MAMLIYGNIRDLSGNFPTDGYVIAVNYTGYSVSGTTDGEEYQIYTAQAGLYEITIYHSGYVPITRDHIEVLPDGIIDGKPFDTYTNCDFTEVSGYSPRGCMEGYITDENSNVIKDALVWGKHIDFSKSYGCKTTSSGYYVLSLHTDGTYYLNYGKNNYNVEYEYDTFVLDTALYPTTTIIQDFTLERRISDCLPVDGRSVIIFDDMSSTGSYLRDLFATPYNVVSTKVYAKTRRIGTGSAYHTSDGSGNGEGRCGSGGTNYNGGPGLHPENPDPEKTWITTVDDLVWACDTSSDCTSVFTTTQDPGSSPDERLEVSVLTVTETQATLRMEVFLISDDTVLYDNTITLYENQYCEFSTIYRYWNVEPIELNYNPSVGGWAKLQLGFTITD